MTQSVTSLDKQCRYMHKVSPHLISTVDSGTKCHLTGQTM